MGGAIQCVYRKTINPRVLYNKTHRTWSINVSYIKGTRAKRETKKKAGFLTEDEAWDAVDDFRAALEVPRRKGKDGVVLPRKEIVERVTVQTRKSFKRVKRMMGWKNLTLDQWKNHTDLVNFSRYEDVIKGLSLRAILRLDQVFGAAVDIMSGVFKARDRSADDCIRYMISKAVLLRNRAAVYKEEANILASSSDLRYVHKLLFIEHEKGKEEDDISIVSFKRASSTRLPLSKVPDEAISDNFNIKLIMNL